jgi:hypothetical protein
MTHGPAKRRDIARSVLPSTRRAAARHELARLKRAARRRLRQELAHLDRDDLVDRVDPRGYPTREIRDVVWDRRLGDKLGPLLRWARATTRDLPSGDRLDAVARVLGDDLIGRHAISRLERDSHFRRPDAPLDWIDLLLRRSETPPADATPDLRRLAVEVLAGGRHADFNRWMKRHPDDAGRVRVLLGIHDVDAFADESARVRPWRRAAFSFRRPTATGTWHVARQQAGRS